MVEPGLIKKKYIVMDKSDSVSKLIGHLKNSNQKAALVFDGHTLLGVADTHMLVRTKLDPVKMKVGKIVRRVPILTGAEDIKETARLFFTANTRILPVGRPDSIVGAVNSMDLIKELTKTEDARKKLKEIMKLTPTTIDDDECVGTAISIMRERKISRIPVVDKDGNLVNIVSLTQLLFNFTLLQQSKTERRGRASPVQFGNRTIRAFRQRTDYNAFPISNITPSFLVTALPDDTLGRTIEKMERFDISSIIVIENKKPVGIVTTRDMLKLFLKDLVTY